MKTYNFEMVANAPMLKGAVMECANESRTTKALAVFNTLEMMGIELQTALYKRVAKKYVDSDKAVMMAFAEYQAKGSNAESVDLSLYGIFEDMSRTAKMRKIFDYCHNNGMDAKAMRAECERLLNYHNTGRIYNTWKEWENARIAEIKAAKAAARKAKRAATIAAKKAAAETTATPESKPARIVFNVTTPKPQEVKDIIFDVEITDEAQMWIEFETRYNEYITNAGGYGLNLYRYRLRAPENVFDDIAEWADSNGMDCNPERNYYTIYINNVDETGDAKTELFLNAAKRSPEAPPTKVLKDMMKAGKLVIA